MEVQILGLDEASILLIASLAQVSVTFGWNRVGDNGLAFVSAFALHELVRCGSQDVQRLKRRFLARKARVEIVKQRNLFLLRFDVSQSR